MSLPAPPAPLSPPPSAADGRSRIIAAARELFLANGFMAVSMQQIADAAGVNKATLYHHFTDKEALFVEIMRLSFVTAQGAIAVAVAGASSLPDQLRRIALLIFASPLTDMGRLMADLREHVSPERRLALTEQVAAPWTEITSLLSAARQRGEIRDVDPELASRAFFIMVASQLGWAKYGGCPPPGPETAEALVDLIMHGIGRPAAGACPLPSSPSTPDAD